MNYKLIAHGGGGIFSILMDLVIPHAYCLNDIENIFIEIQDNEYGCPRNGFDFVFDQTCDRSYKQIHCGFVGPVKVDEKVKEICKKFKFNFDYPDCYPTDLGVHYRGIDMNNMHPKYGIFGFANYKNKIDKIINENSISSIFVASDNSEAADRLINLYDNKIPTFYFTEFIRAATLKDDTFKIQVENSPKERFWKEAFIDMISLSRCNYLLCRTSNFSKAAIAFSDTLTKIYKL